MKFPSLALVSSWLSGRILDWCLSQPGFDPSFGNLACLVTLMSSDRTKQICLWMTIYIYMYIYVCVYIYIYICVYVCIYIYMCVYVCIYIYICLCIYIYVYMYVCMYVCITTSGTLPR